METATLNKINQTRAKSAQIGKALSYHTSLFCCILLFPSFYSSTNMLRCPGGTSEKWSRFCLSASVRQAGVSQYKDACHDNTVDIASAAAEADGFPAIGGGR
jgi:hypothetical protein